MKRRHDLGTTSCVALACLLCSYPSRALDLNRELLKGPLSIIPKAASSAAPLPDAAKIHDAAKAVEKAGIAKLKIYPLDPGYPATLTGSLLQTQGAFDLSAFDVVFTDTARLKAEADRIAEIVRSEPAESHSVLFDLQKKYQANRTYKLTIPDNSIVFATLAAESSNARIFQSSASASLLEVNEAVASALDQASRTPIKWLDTKSVPFMASYGVLGAAAKTSKAAAPLAKSYENVFNQFSKAVETPTDQRIGQFVESAGKFKADFAALWPTIKDDPVARNAAAATYNGLARQRVLKAQYGVLTNFPPLSYEQVFYFSRHVVTLKDGSGPICSGMALTKQWIITAGHCFRGRSWTDVKVVFDLEGLGLGSLPLSIIDQWPEPAPGSNPQDDIDFAFIRVEDDEGQGKLYDELEGLVKSKPYSAEPLCIKTVPVGYKQPVFAVGFPMGQSKTVHDYAYVWFPFKVSESLYNQLGAETYAEAYKMEVALRRPTYADSVRKNFEAAYSKTVTEGGQVSRLYFAAAFQTAMRPSFGIDTDTFAGDSGSPVFDRSTRCLVGIFSSGQRDTLAASETSWREHEVAIPISEIIARIRSTDKNQTFGGRALDDDLRAGREELLKRLTAVTNVR